MTDQQTKNPNRGWRHPDAEAAYHEFSELEIGDLVGSLKLEARACLDSADSGARSDVEAKRLRRRAAWLQTLADRLNPAWRSTSLEVIRQSIPNLDASKLTSAKPIVGGDVKFVDSARLGRVSHSTPMSSDPYVEFDVEQCFGAHPMRFAIPDTTLESALTRLGAAEAGFNHHVLGFRISGRSEEYFRFGEVVTKQNMKKKGKWTRGLRKEMEDRGWSRAVLLEGAISEIREGDVVIPRPEKSDG